MSDETDKSARVPLGDIFRVFFEIGLLSFGGGLVSWIHREVVGKRGVREGDIHNAVRQSGKQRQPSKPAVERAVTVGALRETLDNLGR